MGSVVVDDMRLMSFELLLYLTRGPFRMGTGPAQVG